MMIAILYHALKLWAIVGVQAGQAAIRVYFNDRHAVFFGKAFASADLPFNGFLTLIMARKTGVYGRFHAITYFKALLFAGREKIYTNCIFSSVIIIRISHKNIVCVLAIFLYTFCSACR